MSSILTATAHKSTSGFSRRRIVRCLTIAVALISFGAACCSAQTRIVHLQVVEQSHAGTQHFFCATNYPAGDCAKDIATLNAALLPYSPQTLGEWSWILVSGAGWKPMLEAMGLNPVSPAITSYADRETFFDQSLFAPNDQRKAEWSRQFPVPLSQLLTVAITHEIGHALCRDSSELSAERAATQLRGGHPAGCAAPPMLSAMQRDAWHR